MDNQTIEIHRENYRIAFDAMRAYHVSEIEHKRDMITILNGILATIVTVYAGIFYIIIQPNLDVFKTVLLVSLPILMLVIFVLINDLRQESVIKLRGDNDRYEKFRNECIIERYYLGLNKYYEQFDKKDLYWSTSLPKDMDKKIELPISDQIKQLEEELKSINITLIKRIFVKVKYSIFKFREKSQRQKNDEVNEEKYLRTLRLGTGFIKTVAIIRTYSELLISIQVILGVIASITLLLTIDFSKVPLLKFFT